MNKRKLFLSVSTLFFLSTLFFSCSKEVRKYRKYSLKGTVAQQDSAAFFFYNREDYEKSAVLFEGLLGYYRASTRYQEILYYLAYSRYNQKRYLQASSHFEQFTKQFPSAERTEECAYMLALCYYNLSYPYYLDQSPTLKAMDQLQYFIVSYPYSDHVEQCNQYLSSLRERLAKKSLEQARLYYKTEDYIGAVTSFEVMIQEFPDSRYREEAQYMWFRSAAALADVSTQRRKENRYKDAIDLYEEFVDRYPNSPFIKDAEQVYAKVKLNLGEILAEQEESR